MGDHDSIYIFILRCRRNSRRFDAGVPEKKTCIELCMVDKGFGAKQYQKTTLASNPKRDYYNLAQKGGGGRAPSGFTYDYKYLTIFCMEIQYCSSSQGKWSMFYIFLSRFEWMSIFLTFSTEMKYYMVTVFVSDWTLSCLSPSLIFSLYLFFW